MNSESSPSQYKKKKKSILPNACLSHPIKVIRPPCCDSTPHHTSAAHDYCIVARLTVFSSLRPDCMYVAVGQPRESSGGTSRLERRHHGYMHRCPSRSPQIVPQTSRGCLHMQSAAVDTGRVQRMASHRRKLRVDDSASAPRRVGRTLYVRESGASIRSRTQGAPSATPLHHLIKRGVHNRHQKERIFT